MKCPAPCRNDQSRSVRHARWGRRAGRFRPARGLTVAALVTALTVVCSGCMPWTSRGPPTGAQTAGRHRAVITVGAFDFPVIARDGAGLVTVLNSVSARLDTLSLRALDTLVEIRGQDPRQVADSWLRAHGLIPGGDVR